uniref:calmodulin-binding protein 60 E-like n=1 Tax=Erigeron canadensis TaxID=72917 RepID=UPI001CB926D9|nr:calmodulin-binding protein 60 E-like [Erigeron canadensis]XP_043607760.1 calmodulin-binding protein 60 E-like [Erigeron canadensis]XP_043607761.1 calmodulin-binding protein 60 E-like [Erigeron canadensis]
MANRSDNDVYAAKPQGYKLRFLTTEVASPVFTGKKDRKGIVASDGGYIQVELIDNETDEPVIDGPLASKQVKMVLLPANFGDVWTSSEFKNSIQNHLGKKKNILLGDDLSIDLKYGRGTIRKIWIKHDKNHLRKVKFRLGAMMEDCFCEIKEAVTEPFEVKDRRNELISKKRQLTIDDKVSQLKNVGRRGPCCKRLVNENIKTVKDFLDRLSSDPLALQMIYGSSGKRWEQTICHAKSAISAKTCNACESSVGSASHMAPILVNHDGVTELAEVRSYEPISPSSNEITTFDQPFDAFSFIEQYNYDDEILYVDPFFWADL